jgi:ATP/ADP translocase
MAHENTGAAASMENASWTSSSNITSTSNTNGLLATTTTSSNDGVGGNGNDYIGMIDTTHYSDDDESGASTNINDNDIQQRSDGDDNTPLLSSYFQQKVKMGPFSIRYDNPLSPRSKPLGRYNEDDESDDEEDEAENSLIPHFIRHKLHRSSIFCHHHFNVIVPPPRILLLSIYLMTTLSTFWILDSIKEPTLAILVDGELGKHQPRAKMFSFVVVVLLAFVMEGMVQWRRRRRRKQQEQQYRWRMRRRRGHMMEDTAGGDDDERGVPSFTVEEDRNAELERSWQDRNLPSCSRDSNDDFDAAQHGRGGGINGWKRMGIRMSSNVWNRFRWSERDKADEDDEDDDGSTSASKIPTVVFYIVGSVYIHAFITVALALRQHPSFRLPDDSESLRNIDNNTGSSSADASDGGWYYPTLGYVLFALIESYGSVSITIFWAFANSHLTLEAAERHYGSTVALAQMGAIGGSTLVTILGRTTDTMEGKEVDVFDITQDGGDVVRGGSDAHVTPMLIFLACVFVGVGMAVMALYARLFTKPMRSSTIAASSEGQASIIRASVVDNDDDGEEKVPRIDDAAINNTVVGGLFGGVHMIIRHEYLQLVLAVSVLYEIALTCMHYEMNLIGLDRFGVGISVVEDESSEYGGNDNNYRTSTSNARGITYIQFLGWYGQTVNVLSLFLSFYAFPRLIKHYGLSITIRIFPTVLLLVTIFAFVLFPQNLYFLFVSLSICKALTYSVHDPAEEVLYMPTSNDAKFRAKFWIDVVGQRIAKAVGSAINNYAGSIEGIVKYGSLPSIIASLGLWLACYQVGIQFDQLVVSGDVVGLDGTSSPMLCEHSSSVELCKGYAAGGMDDDNNEENEIRLESGDARPPSVSI